MKMQRWLIEGTQADMCSALVVHIQMMRQQQGSKNSQAADHLIRSLQEVKEARKGDWRQWIITGTEEDVWRATLLHASVQKIYHGNKLSLAADRLMRSLRLLDETEMQEAQEENERSTK